MPLIQWEPKYVTGNPVVDRQHQELFKMVNTLHDALATGKGKDVLGPTLDHLANYVVTHFKMEEGLMTTMHYPNFPRHKDCHVKLTQQATDIIQQYKSGKLVLSLTLSQFLGDWLKQHIQQEDITFISWLKQHQKTSTAATV